MTPSQQQAFDALTAAIKWIEEAKPLLERGGKCEVLLRRILATWGSDDEAEIIASRNAAIELLKT